MTTWFLTFLFLTSTGVESVRYPSPAGLVGCNQQIAAMRLNPASTTVSGTWVYGSSGALVAVFCTQGTEEIRTHEPPTPEPAT